jgi:hypothetical protein
MLDQLPAESNELVSSASSALSSMVAEGAKMKSEAPRAMLLMRISSIRPLSPSLETSRFSFPKTRGPSMAPPPVMVSA